jgi:uncharacterized protein
MNLQLLFFIGVVQGILFVVHYIVYKTILFFGEISVQATTYVKYSFLALSIFFFIGSFITSYGFTLIGRVVYGLAATWLGVLFWLFFGAIFSLCLWGISTYIFPTLHTQHMSLGSHTYSVKQFYGLIVLLVIIGMNIYGLYHARHVRVKEYTVALPNLPASWERKQIVVVADTHFGNIWNTGTAKKISSLITSLRPETVLIVGDFFDGPVINFEEVAQPFGAIPTKYGVLYVTGNHEEYRDRAQYTNALSVQGVTVLHNEYKNLDGLIVAGIAYGDSTTKEKQDAVLKAMLSTSTSTDISPVILMKHVPNLLESAENAGVDLQVSGHTHNGQMWIASRVARAIYGTYVYGLNVFSSSDTSTRNVTAPMQILTTSGAGSWGPPQRIGTQNEIVLLTLIGK